MIFGKKTPANVVEAVAPLKTVVDGLKAVVAAQTNRAKLAEFQIVSAKNSALRVETEQKKVISAASTESEQANNVLAKLEALLSPQK